MNDDMQVRLTALLDALAAAVGAHVQGEAETAPGDEAPAKPWMVTLTAMGEGTGRCTLWIDQAGALTLSALSAGPGDVTDASTSDLLRRLVSQAVGDVAARAEAERLDLSVTSVERAPTDLLDGAAVIRRISVKGLDLPVVVAATWSAVTDITAPRAVAESRMGSRIDVILDIDLPVVVRFGHTELPIRALSQLGPGSVIDLGRSPDDPVEVLVSNRVVARGEVVIVGGNYGVRILDVTSQSERAHSMEA